MTEGVKIKWVTKFVTSKKWDEFYSQSPGYTLIEKVKGGYKIGFCVVGDVPSGCIEASESDLEKIRQEREREHAYPLP